MSRNQRPFQGFWIIRLLLLLFFVLILISQANSSLPFQDHYRVIPRRATSTPTISYTVDSNIGQFQLVQEGNLALLLDGNKLSQKEIAALPAAQNETVNALATSVTDRVTLNAIGVGTPISTESLGPRMTKCEDYQVIRMKWLQPLSGLSVGNVVTIELLLRKSSNESQAAKSRTAVDAVVLQIGNIGEDGLIEVYAAVSKNALATPGILSDKIVGYVSTHVAATPPCMIKP